MVLVYRGLHCPLCKKYLAQLDEMIGQFNAIGVDVLAVSGDPKIKAQAMVEEKNLTLNIGYGMTIDQMASLGLYVSDPRSEKETDRPYAEPGLFVINSDGNIQILDASNAPFSRPDLNALLNGIRFIRENNYPIRGTHLHD
jgi:peroxiredoxin